MSRPHPDGGTQVFAVLGHPVAHSLSPAMHNASLRALGINAVYLAFDVEERHVPAAIEGMRRMGFGGTNVTIPLKHAAYRAVGRLAPCAQRLGVVNTIAYVDGDTVGYNTDGMGILADLWERFGLTPRGARVLVLGCGGAGRAVALTLAAEGAAHLTLANRTPARARAVADDLRALAPALPVDALPGEPAAWADAAAQADLVVQCTASGMHPDDPPLLPAGAFRRDQCVYDLVYTQPLTPTLRAAADAGARVANGLGMLLHQGAAAYRIWTGRAADLPAMRRALDAALAGGTPCARG